MCQNDGNKDDEYEKGILHGLNLARQELNAVQHKIYKSHSMNIPTRLDALLDVNVRLNRLINKYGGK